MNRRLFLSDLARYSALAATTPNLWRLRWRPTFADNPFSLGVAAGDPATDRAVIWTRLAVRPLEPLGGMPAERPVVRWEVAHDEQFTRVVKKGNATATPELAHSIHIDVNGLDADRWYFYRFMTGDAMSDVGRIRTTPKSGAEVPLKFVFASCQNYEQGLFTAIQHMSEEDVDLGVHLGDYIYETAAPAPDQMGTRVRKHEGPNIHTIHDYRQRYAQYKSDPALRAMHARCPWLIIWDDHEVDNNYATLVNESKDEDEASMRVRRAAAYQAWYEHMPVRLAPPKNWTDFRIYRSMNWGRLAQFWAIDDRQYRTDQACGDGIKPIPCDGYDAPGQTMLGDEQETWFENGLAKSKAKWQVLANQVVFSPADSPPKPGDRVHMDQWGGYPKSQTRMLAAIGDHAPNRTVVMTGDIHNSWVYDTRRGFDKSDRPVVAAEFVGTSLSSGGNGTDDIRSVTDAYKAEHPSLKWANNRRGYVRCQVTPTEWRAEYRVVPFVDKPGAPIQTASSWLLANGKPGLERL